jgi:hypothetical protein
MENASITEYVPMIREVTIENFKGIKHCSVDHLAQINLFVGKNNSCKSTILEGIYYSLKEMGDSRLNRIFQDRTNVFAGISELWYNYTKEREPISFRISLYNLDLSLDLTYNDENKMISCTPKFFDRATRTSYPSPPPSMYYGDWGIARAISYQDYGTRIPPDSSLKIRDFIKGCLFLESSVKKDVNSIERLLGTLKSKGMTDTFGEYLFTIFGQGLKWEFMPCIDRQGEYRAATYINGIPLFISGLGDGMRYALYIVASCILSKNTTIFIEEIESNQHPESLGKLISFLVKLAKENNLQLFISTQSISLAWGYFEKEFTPEEREKYFKCFAVERDMKTGLVTCTPQSKEDQTTWDSSIHKQLYGNH